MSGNSDELNEQSSFFEPFLEKTFDLEIFKEDLRNIYPG